MARLRIGAAEARRRLSLAGDLLPRQGFSGDPLPPAREELGAAVAAGEVSSRAATIITLALDRVRHTCDPEAAAGMEHALTRTAAENDPDLLARVARSWTDALDQDGPSPPKNSSASSRAPSSANPATDCSTSKSSRPPNNANTSSPS